MIMWNKVLTNADVKINHDYEVPQVITRFFLVSFWICVLNEAEKKEEEEEEKDIEQILFFI